MELDAVIKKTILTTLAAIGALLLFIVIGLWALFPSTSMELAYDMGMESSCIRFAERAYKGSDDVYFIAYATEVAIEEENEGKIISCGEKFIKDEGFETYCALKGDTYEQFIYGRVCVSKYQAGQKEDAVSLACQSLHGAFPKGNALVAVLLTSLKENDRATVNTVKTKLNTLSVDGEDAKYLQETLETLAKLEG